MIRNQLFACLFSIFLTVPAFDITTLKGIPDSEYIAEGKKYPAVGMITVESADKEYAGTESLISLDSKVGILTAAHVFTDTNKENAIITFHGKNDETQSYP